MKRWRREEPKLQISSRKSFTVVIGECYGFGAYGDETANVAESIFSAEFKAIGRAEKMTGGPLSSVKARISGD